jgi:hypothetical protein
MIWFVIRIHTGIIKYIESFTTMKKLMKIKQNWPVCSLVTDGSDDACWSFTDR